MEKAIQGKKIKLMFRLTRERATTAAKLLALEISHEYKSETKTDTQSTKDGNVPTSGMPSASIEMEFLRTGTETYTMLKYAYRNGLEIDVWRINFDKKTQKQENTKQNLAQVYWIHSEILPSPILIQALSQL